MIMDPQDNEEDDVSAGTGAQGVAVVEFVAACARAMYREVVRTGGMRFVCPWLVREETINITTAQVSDSLQKNRSGCSLISP